MNNDRSREALLRKIQELSFAKDEAQLFLDTHPECKMALDFFKKMTEELDVVMTEYQNNFGPLTSDAVMGDKWTWCDGPWPWQRAGDENRKGGL